MSPCSPPQILRQGLSVNQELPYSARPAGSRDPPVCLPIPGIGSEHHMLGVLHVLGTGTQILVHGKHLPSEPPPRPLGKLRLDGEAMLNIKVL